MPPLDREGEFRTVGEPETYHCRELAKRIAALAAVAVVILDAMRSISSPAGHRLEEVALLTGSSGFTFLEYLPTGAVQTTTAVVAFTAATV